MKKKPDDLDTETTFVDMNVEGFRWYDPVKKKRDSEQQKTVPHKVPRREYWKMVRGAFAAFFPYFIGILCIFGIMIAVAYLWLS